MCFVRKIICTFIKKSIIKIDIYILEILLLLIIRKNEHDNYEINNNIIFIIIICIYYKNYKTKKNLKLSTQ